MRSHQTVTLLFILCSALLFVSNSYASCDDDIRDYCYEVYKKDGDLLGCLVANKNRLLRSCREDIESIREAWKKMLLECQKETVKYCDKSTAKRPSPFPDCLMENKRGAYQACRRKIRDYEWALKSITHVSIRPRSRMHSPLAAKVGGDDYFRPVKTTSALLGCWKRINFSESAMREMNQVEPFPLEHQWYCFLDDGKYQEMLSNRDDGKTIEQRLKLMNVFSGQDYSIPSPGIVAIKHPDRKEQAIWVTSIIIKNITLWGVDLKLGDMLMTMRDPASKKDIHYRFMRKVRQ